MNPPDTDQGAVLLALARAAIAEAVGVKHPAVTVSAPWLNEPGATFVTLTRDGELRGCIGSIHPHRSLCDDVRYNAVAAARRDHRFTPVTAVEFPAVQVEVSVLDAPVDFPVASEQDACRRLRPNIDGVVLEYGNHTALFLPQVWESLPDPRDFLAHLKHKAGLTPDFWHPQLKLSRYQVQKFTEATHGHAG